MMITLVNINSNDYYFVNSNEYNFVNINSNYH